MSTMGAAFLGARQHDDLRKSSNSPLDLRFLKWFPLPPGSMLSHSRGKKCDPPDPKQCWNENPSFTLNVRSLQHCMGSGGTSLASAEVSTAEAKRANIDMGGGDFRPKCIKNHWFFNDFQFGKWRSLNHHVFLVSRAPKKAAPIVDMEALKNGHFCFLPFWKMIKMETAN